MSQFRFPLVALAAAAAVITACSDSTAPATGDLTDTSMATDIASSAGDAIATSVSSMIANGTYIGASTDIAAVPSGQDGLTVNRTRTCYDAGGTVVTCGQGLTASALVTLTIDGSASGEHFTAVVHRQARDSIAGLDSGSTSRTHNGYGASQDTATFTHELTTRTAGIAASDSVLDLVFNLPHASNPWPVSGQIIRNVDATFTVTRGATKTRHIVRRVVVTFPADAQGNVPIVVGTLSCSLNLVTHKVTGCTGS
ncbi:MAG TPA: hypothetical protein VFK16_09255 [Gemmatimonadaceae bacterium]|nr:hypothetical protein [Gemmatimonadaceae bacterium]